jgi:CubicO group peptidase (beta-lactamase class C family)
MTRPPDLQGYADGAFASLADVFRSGFQERGELGAAFCVYHRGQKVVDLWGGLRDSTSHTPWQEDTVVPVFSTGKGIASITCALASARGHFTFDDTVAAHWPGFAQNGKDAITVRDLLAHKAGLVLFGRRLNRASLGNPATVAGVLQDMSPLWQPGRAWGYHIGSFGLLVGELMRRTDPLRRSLGRFFDEAIAAPLGLAFHFGVPAAISDERIARIVMPKTLQIWQGLRQAPHGLVAQAFNPFSLLHRAGREIVDMDMNDRRWLANEFPSANGIGEPRAIARLYSCLATGGAELGIGEDLLAELTGEPNVPPGGRRDRLMGVDSLWHLGFMRPTSAFPFSPSARAFGMPGLGGSFGFCDPDREIGYAYVPNRLGALPFNDPRERSLREALYAILDRL